MKHLLLTTIAAVVLVGCGPSVDIHEAAEAGNIEAVKQYLADGEDVNANDEFGFTPLLHAASSGHKEIVELLISNGANVNAKGDLGTTPLLWAAINGHKEVVELLIAKGADVMAKRAGRTPLHRAASNGHKEIVELLIANGADVNDIAGEGGWGTPLHRARTKEVAELLILRGANVNAKTTSGRTPGRTPLDVAAEWQASAGPQQGIIEIADLLRKHGGKMSDWFNADKSIHTAASGGNIEAVKQHLAAGADVNAKNDREWQSFGYQASGPDATPLHPAALYGHKEVVELLITAGADVNTKEKYEKTPLHHATRAGYYEIVKMLIAAGADVNVKNIAGKTPLDFDGNADLVDGEIADLLRKHGAKHGEKPAPALGDEYDLVEVEDTDGDGVDDYDESLLGSDGKPIGDKDDPKITPTSAQIKAGTPP